ncbi:hypothetical protein [Mesorhizobium sp. KR9-304]|uniref:hypothetical protein n=1 Tax=Mesorhizobium sp. KR9-304 TaxID=3156614 RepID=UPI0032B4D322
MMEKVLAAYCAAHNVTNPIERDDLAMLILELFDMGSREEEALLAELIKRRPMPAT